MFWRGAFIVVAGLVLFAWAIQLQGGIGDSAKAAAVFALISAIAWGLGSMGGPNVWNSGTNVFAAFAAAVVAGFTVPSAPACRDAYVKIVCQLDVGWLLTIFRP